MFALLKHINHEAAGASVAGIIGTKKAIKAETIMIDKGYAPPGYEAEGIRSLEDPCDGCEFDFAGDVCGLELLALEKCACIPPERPDRESVIFVRKNMRAA